MRVEGTTTLHAPVEAVWRSLRDPAVLVATIPGCRTLELTGPDTYRMTVDAGVGSIRGTYTGEVRLTDQVEPASFVLRAAAQGGPGTVTADVAVRLAPADGGRTELAYDADAVVGGVVAGVGQRMLAAVARRTAAEFFAAVDGVLAGGPALAPAAGPPEPAAVPAAPAAQGGAPEPPPTTWTAPARPAAAAPAARATVAATAAGALAALAGVAVGWVLGRRAPGAGR